MTCIIAQIHIGKPTAAGSKVVGKKIKRKGREGGRKGGKENCRSMGQSQRLNHTEV